VSRTVCIAGEIIQRLPEDQREEYIQRTHDEGGVTWTRIAEALRSSGYEEAREPSLRRHMRGHCLCGKRPAPIGIIGLFTPAGTP
jgi:hypothetical protein